MKKKVIATLLAAAIILGFGSTVYADGIRFPILPAPGCTPNAFIIEPEMLFEEEA